MSERSTRKITVVNDDQLLRASMACSLGANEYDVSTTTDSYDALSQLKHGLVDLIISDLEIPGMPGREFLSIIRCPFSEILVIALDETDDGEVETSVALVLLSTIGLH